MWRKIMGSFKESPRRLAVAKALLRHGFSIDKESKKDSKNSSVIVKCGNIHVPLKSIGDALGIDRRTVRATVDDIYGNEELRVLYSRILPAGPSLEKVSEIMGYGVVTIYVHSPEDPGILSEVTQAIAGYNIAIRQVLAEDVAIYEEPCLKVITKTPLPGAVIETLSSIRGVTRVIIGH